MRRIHSWIELTPATLLVVACTPALCAMAEPDPGQAGLSSAATTPAAAPRLVTPLDYFERGRQAVSAFVGEQERTGSVVELEQLIERLKPRCVRLEIRFDRAGSRYRSVIGSGILIDGGRRVYTAGHSFDGVEDSEVVVTLPGGTSRVARLEVRAHPSHDSTQDWALLEIRGEPVKLLDDVEFGPAHQGEIVLVFGYPDQIGIDASGSVAYASSTDGAYREPLVSLATVEEVEPLVLSPLAGAVPTGGMSGGPVFDVEGRLVGLFVSVARIESDGEVSYTFAASPTASLRQRLLAR